jgi:regulator of protease activity HflC (stomatin/prohibitin superfamily)
VCVRQDEFVAEQNFGRFLQVLGPGFHFLGVDACGCCIQLKKLSRRVHQSTIVTRTITKDRTAVALQTAVQQAVSEDGVFEAFYRLSDIDRQLSAYVADVVLSSVPRLTLEELFVKFDSIGRQIHKHLQYAMSEYGIQIVQVLVLDARLDEQVKEAFAEAVIQRNLRGAALATAEAEAVRVVKGAEADAEQMALQGRGMALKREALAQGLVRSVMGDVETDASSFASVASGTLVELLLTMEYFDTLREIGSRASHAVFLQQEPRSASRRSLNEPRSPREGRTGSKGTTGSAGSGWTTSTVRSIASSFGRRRPSINSTSSQISKRSPKRPSNPERDIAAIEEEGESDR